MKKLKMLPFMFLLVLVANLGLGAQDIFEQIERSRRWDLADAYYQAGVRFEELGLATRGRQFKTAAREIFPGYTPGESLPAQAAETEPELPAAEVPEGPINPLTGIAARPQVRERNMDGARVVRFQFLRMIRGLLNADTSSMETVLDETIYAPGYEDGISRQQFLADLDVLFENVDFTDLSLDDLYDTGSIRVEALDNSINDWRVLVNAAAEPALDFGELFTFWGPEQVFVFRRVDDTWKLYGAAPHTNQ